MKLNRLPLTKDGEEVRILTMPTRPRFRIEGMFTSSVDLLPCLSDTGDVVADWWQLPAKRNHRGELVPAYISTEELLVRCLLKGWFGRILN